MGITLEEAKYFVKGEREATESLISQDGETDSCKLAMAYCDDDFEDKPEGLAKAMLMLIEKVQEAVLKSTGPVIQMQFIDYVSLPWETNIERPCAGCLGVKGDGRM